MDELEITRVLPEEAEARRQETGRQCGACSMCCYILGVDDPPEISKPPDTWCQHCKPGKGGCAIYAQRPRLCRSFVCHWLVDPGLGDAWYPLTARIVVHGACDEDGANPCLVFEVDPRTPDRWLQDPYFQQISNIALVYRGTTIRVGRRRFMLLPCKGIDQPRVSTVMISGAPAKVVPGKIGPARVKALQPPFGEYRWFEVAPPAELIEQGWKHGYKYGRASR